MIFKRRMIPYLLMTAFVLQAASFPSWAEDWPTYRHDRTRSGVSSESLKLPLEQVWAHTSKLHPQPAWPGPARSDGWHKVENLKPRLIFDWAFHVALAGGGVYFGSSADDKVHCLDAGTGQEKWSVFTDGPVRLAPTIDKGKVYAGSDDGTAYCLAAGDGSTVWKYKAGPRDYNVPGNSRLMSVWPVRSGIVVKDDVAFFTAGLFPFEGSYVCAVKANDGSEIWKQLVPGMAPQGYALASADRLFVPTGRGTPFVFDLQKGDYLYTAGGSGGTFCLLSDDKLVYGPGVTGTFEAFNPGEEDAVATFNGNQMIVTPERSFLHTDTELRAIDRVRYLDISLTKAMAEKELGGLNKQARRLDKDGDSPELADLRKRQEELKTTISSSGAELGQCLLWSHPCNYPYSLILAGGTLFAGGTGGVAAFSSATGEMQWSADVPGRALDLAVADGRLVVSTDKGSILCFATK